MQPAQTVGIFILLLRCAEGIVIDKVECGTKFYCPDNCKVSYKENGCPHNCNCGSLKKCPLVTCPAREPACAVYTQLDGCQSCACRLPYVIVGKDETNAPDGFMFVNHRTMIELRRRLRDIPGEETKEAKGRHIIRAQLCTIGNMDTVDRCLADVANFHDVLQEKQLENEIITLNPMVRTSRQDLVKMCDLYRNALICMKRYIFTVCRRTHPTLAEIDSIYGYSCGPKQHIFLDHLECLQRSHLESYRLAVCEDSTHRALRFIESSSFDVEEKQKQKCEALNWLMGCEKATMMKRCSLEASIVNGESLLSASQYVAPECHADFQRKIFVRAEMDEASDGIKENETNEVEEEEDDDDDGDVDGDNDNNSSDNDDKSSSALVEREPLKCTEKQQEEIKYNFRFLESDLRNRATTYTVAYPVVYSYSEGQLEQKCAEYQRAYANITALAKRNCIRRHPQYSMVYFTLEYPCGHGTKDSFFSHFNCLKAIRKEKEVEMCEKRAARSLNDPSNNPCETYNILTQCMYDTVVMECGYNGWESEYQYIAMYVKNTVPDCRVKRIIRNARVNYILN